MVRAISKAGVEPATTEAAFRAIERYERLIADDAGDRSSLDAILSAWVPEARQEFELRRKQSAFRAMSQLRGVQVDALMATVFLAPSANPERLDVVWVNGLFGLHRLRPGVGVKLATRRITQTDRDRSPRTLDGERVESLVGLMLNEFCSSPAPDLDVHRINDAVLYTLRDGGFGPLSATDIVFAEANRDEMSRYAKPDVRRKTFVFAEVSTPSKVLQFDALVHQDLFAGQEPSLRMYDTSLEGVADANDPTRDLDRLEMIESVKPLGVGVSRCRSADIRRYADLLRTVCSRIGWDSSSFRAFRCRVDYPIYGSQVMMTWDQPHAR